MGGTVLGEMDGALVRGGGEGGKGGGGKKVGDDVVGDDVVGEALHIG